MRDKSETGLVSILGDLWSTTRGINLLVSNYKFTNVRINMVEAGCLQMEVKEMKDTTLFKEI